MTKKRPPRPLPPERRPVVAPVPVRADPEPDPPPWAVEGPGSSAPGLTPRRESRSPTAAVPLLVVLASVACLFVLLRSGHQDAVHDAGSGTHRDAAGVTGRRVTPPVPTQVPATGSYVESRILANGDLQVTHWIRSRTPVASLALRLPEMSDATTPLSASGVLVAAGDQRADGARTLRSGGTTYRLARPSKVVYVRYALHGAVEQRGSVLGRALARVTSLDLRYGRPYGPTEVDVLGAKVLAVACTPRADQESIPRPCGGPGPGRWRVRLHGSSRTDRVMAQIELG